MELVNSHGGAAQALAAGIHALPGATSSLAATQGAYRFLNNPNVTLADLAEPVIDLARELAAVLQNPEVREKLVKNAGVTVAEPVSPQAMRAELATQIAKWKKVVADAKIPQQ